jgi:hypothetical protein
VRAVPFDVTWRPFVPPVGRYNRFIVVPLWIPLVLLLAVTAAVWRVEVLARRRAVAGACVKCGYDCSGIGVKAVCPECGTVAQV